MIDGAQNKATSKFILLPPLSIPAVTPRLHANILDQSGVMDVVALLEGFPEDVTAVDTKGNSSVHVASSAVDYELVKVCVTAPYFVIVALLQSRVRLTVDWVVWCSSRSYMCCGGHQQRQ